MHIIELLKARGLDVSAKVKMLRHQDNRYDIARIYREGFIEFYQSNQAADILKCAYIVSFLGLEGNTAQFIGVWRVKGRLATENVVVPDGYPYPEHYQNPGEYYYALEEVPGFEDIKERVIMDWGKSTRSWHQWLTKKTVLEILPVGYVAAFPGYLDFVLSFDELTGIIDNPAANKVWHNMLGAIAGIYLITDKKSGHQYVGSAYGQNGVLGRWRTYVRTGHGGNKELMALLSENDGYKRNFQFTLLRTLPATLTAKEVISFERLYKRKLGSIAHGLNLN